MDGLLYRGKWKRNVGTSRYRRPLSGEGKQSSHFWDNPPWTNIGVTLIVHGKKIRRWILLLLSFT